MSAAPKAKPRKLDVHNFKDACKALRAALDKADLLQISFDEASKAKSDEYFARRTAEESAKSTREQFADLKKRLFDSEQECARLRGYVERVREDDAVADPLVEVDDGNGKRMVSKRYPSNACLPSAGCNAMSANFDNYGNRREKPKHWVTY